VSIRAVADAVGVTSPSIYLHFEDKGELLYEVCQRHFRALDERMVAAAARTDDPLESLLRRGLAYVSFGLENPEHYRILFMAREDELPGRAGKELEDSASFAHMVSAVVRCMDAGVMRRDDPRTITIGLWATAHGLTSLFIAKPNFPWPDRLALAERVLRTHCVGLVGEGGDPGGEPGRLSPSG
jgi:AcrR family transcriptional regulator